MKYDIQSDLFTQKEIERAIATLDEETKNLDVEIYVFNDKEHAKRFTKPYLSSESFALLDNHNNYLGTLAFLKNEEHVCIDLKIFIYEFNLKISYPYEQPALTKLEFFHTLFHELRHAYQHTFFKNFMIQADKHYIQNISLPDYKEQWIEQDANYYAWRIIQGNKEFFNELVDYHNWHTNEPQKPCPIEEVQFI